MRRSPEGNPSEALPLHFHERSMGPRENSAKTPSGDQDASRDKTHNSGRYKFASAN